MAYIIYVTFKDGEKEAVPVWSSALEKEIKHIKELNEDLKSYEVISESPDKEECSYFQSLLTRTKYKLPKEYKDNRKRRKNE